MKGAQGARRHPRGRPLASDAHGGQTIRIRPATPDDAAATLRHRTRTGGETPFLPFGSEGPGRDEAAQRTLLQASCGSDNGLALVAVADVLLTGQAVDPRGPA